MRQSRMAQSMTDIYEREHFVQFYAAEDRLVADLKGFVGGGLKAGEACIVIATPEHIAALNELLAAEAANQPGIDLKYYLALDAEQTLASFMDQGVPDHAKFREVIGAIMREAGKGGRKVRAFGEMVALLWEAGNHEGAVLLEQFWSRASQESSFTLFCAYPASFFDHFELIDMYSRVKSLHTSYIETQALAVQ